MPKDAAAAYRLNVEIAQDCFEWAGKLSELSLDSTRTLTEVIVNTLSREGRDATVALLKEAGAALLRKESSDRG